MEEPNKDAVIQQLLNQQSELYSQIKSMQKDIKSLHDLKNNIPSALDLLSFEEQKKLPQLSKEASESFSKQMFLPARRKRGRGFSPVLESEIKDAQLKAVSAMHAARILNISYPTYKKYAKMYGIDTLRNPHSKGIIKRTNPNIGKYPVNEILAGKFPDFPVYRLKDKLIKSKTKPACCEQCGYNEKRITDGKIPLLLIFEDGNHRNHKLENLKIFCYNCAFTSGKIWVNTRKRRHWVNDPERMQGAETEVLQSY